MLEYLSGVRSIYCSQTLERPSASLFIFEGTLLCQKGEAKWKQ